MSKTQNPVSQDAGVIPALLNRSQSAKYLSISPRTLASLAAAGHIAVVRVSPRRVAFHRDDLDAYIERQRQ